MENIIYDLNIIMDKPKMLWLFKIGLYETAEIIDISFHCLIKEYFNYV